MRPIIDLSTARLEKDPFPFSVVPDVLCDGIEQAALLWFEQAAPWRLTNESFYSQHEFDMRDAELPSEITQLAADTTLAGMRQSISKLFHRRLGATVDVTAHRLTAGQRIRIHDDYIDGGETHRVILQLNRSWATGDGGHLLFFGGREPEDVRVVLTPVSRRAVVFEISRRSHHAVSKVVRGERYSVVYSFHAVDG